MGNLIVDILIAHLSFLKERWIGDATVQAGRRQLDRQVSLLDTLDGGIETSKRRAALRKVELTSGFQKVTHLSDISTQAPATRRLITRFCALNAVPPSPVAHR